MYDWFSRPLIKKCMSTPAVTPSLNLESLAEAIEEPQSKPKFIRSVSFAPEGKLVTVIPVQGNAAISEFHRSQSDSGM